MNDTQKPWRVRLNPPTALLPGHIVEVDDVNHTPICIVHESEHNHRKGTPTRADIAYLINASPELLAALKTALPVLDDCEQQARLTATELRQQASDVIQRTRMIELNKSATNWVRVADCYKADATAARAAIAKAEGKTSKKKGKA